MRGPPIVAKDLRQLPNRRSLKKSCEGEIASSLFSNLREQPDCHQRMPAEVEEVVVETNGVDAQHVFPDFDKVLLEHVPWWKPLWRAFIAFDDARCTVKGWIIIG